MLRPVIRSSNRLIGGSWFFRLCLHRLALPSPHQRSCRDVLVLGGPGSEPFALNQRSRRSERREVFFRGHGGWGAGDERFECGRSGHFRQNCPVLQRRSRQPGPITKNAP